MIRRSRAALSGLAGGAIAVGVAEFVSAVTDSTSPLSAVGAVVIDVAPSWAREFAIDTFGTGDKLFLQVMTLLVMGIAAASFGVRGRQRRASLVSGFAVFAILGVLAVADRPGRLSGSVVAIVLGLGIGVRVALSLIPRLLPGGVTEIPGESRAPLEGDRRQFLGTAGAVGIAAVMGALATGMRRRRDDVAVEQSTVQLPEPAQVDELPPIPASAEIHPTAPFVTPAADFYRIDTALSLPRTNLDDWRLRVGGMVETPLELTYLDLLEMPQVEKVITLCCVSNEVGGRYVGNAVWRGVPLADVLALSGVSSGAEQVFSTSLDGWTCGFPVEVALDGRDALIALAMNDELLPLEHGFPARLVVPGLYGYVSATKWLESIELTTWDREGYWLPRGWARLAPVKTQSRIDVPRPGAEITAGPQAIAGVAWAQHRGIDRVEVSVDGGEWREARLGTDVSVDAWRQWVVEWDATPGDHEIRVRATDGDGETQTEERAPVAPDGATGWHTIRVTVA
ncbi:MAG: sulfite oxidase [Ilumatobacteraceae bacterium]